MEWRFGGGRRERGWKGCRKNIWMMGVSWRTPGYMIREELQRDKLRVRAGRRAWESEERLAEGRGNELARRC